MIGRTLSHYRIIDVLGAGGMGVVYRAHDTRLERDVALKVLPADTLTDEPARKRFRKEALSLSRLNHPTIGMVFDFDTQDGVDFIVMELIPGITLAERLREGALPESEVARIGGQLAEGLSAAHAHGVIHRDIKPANVRLTPEGRVKLLDFGLAQAARPPSETMSTVSVTAAGQVMGTVPYMSPEQLRGERVDGRSDLFSLGTVLYEMATGGRPFPEESQARLISAILTEAPRPLRRVRGDLTAELERIVLRCLEKDRESRYRSAADLATDLSRLAQPGVPVAHPPLSRAVVRRVGIGLAAALGVALAAALVVLGVGELRGRFFGETDGSAVPSLAVLPLESLSRNPDDEYFADGMSEEIITRLAQVRALKVISRVSAMQYKGTKKGLAQIAKELGVRMLVEGTVRRSGDRIRISAELIEALTQRSVWAETFERNPTDVFAVQSEIARALVEQLRARLTPEERIHLAAARQVNPEAHAEYLAGRHLVQSDDPKDLMRAAQRFRKAMDLDPTYAPAYEGLATAYQSASGLSFPPRQVIPLAEANARRALELDSTLADAHILIGWIKGSYGWDWAQCRVELRKALDAYPGDATAHSAYGGYLVVTRRFDEAAREFARAEELDPLSGTLHGQSLQPLYNARRYDDAIAAARQRLKASPDLLVTKHILAQSLLMKGDARGAIALWDEILKTQPNYPPMIGWEAYALGVSGRKDEARAIIRGMEERVGATERSLKADPGQWSGRDFVGSYYIAVAYLGLGDKDHAFAWLEKGLEDRTEDMIFLNVEPAWDSLRSDPRFKAVLRRMGFEA